MKKIFFHNEAISFRLKAKKKIRDWIIQSIIEEGKIPGEINFIFCSDDFLLHINRQFLLHDYYTDVISFDYSEGEVVSGDIFISMDRVKENSYEIDSILLNELLRVMIHGTLHLIGYKDNSSTDKKFMTELENRYLGQFFRSISN
ncbi:MAG: rRNA maturation RNase YbeY [Crocinitomicaceae bacterium]|nr:rRNA maturation RNase YbeY [Crocinitomicaceae bacterium]